MSTPFDVNKVLDEVKKTFEEQMKKSQELFEQTNRSLQEHLKQIEVDQPKAFSAIKDKKPLFRESSQPEPKIPSIFDEQIITEESFSDGPKALDENKRYALEIGRFYLIRTVTMIYTGRLVQIDADAYVLLNAAWIPETLRWHESVRTGIFKEVEPYPDDKPVFVAKSPVLDIVEIPSLPREPK